MTLEAAGVTGTEETVYRLLVTMGRATAREVADRAGLEPEHTRHVLDALAAKNLVSQSDGLPREYRPTPVSNTHLRAHETC
ncbi:helix-turn-helix domain-containing protein, partial [Streptomyces sp. Z38]|uniref:helix-turn-helix domain-containing protein n=1 Tax=Streptomyces sp. Z38 TaxID=2682780 RepID=UPI0013206715|nr:hypothetical protein [Streptomyces sp. Z38]